MNLNQLDLDLDVFQGPFDLLLSLIAKRQLDVTVVALAQVTDEFIAHIRSRGEDWDLDQASGFLVVAATLLVDQNRVWSWSRFGEALDTVPKRVGR